jgi:hypothetical protein
LGKSPSHGAPVYREGVDPGRSLRALEAQGRLRLAGTTRVGDRKAYRLVSGPVRGFIKGSVDRYVYLVDSETYYPLLVRYSTHRGRVSAGYTTRYLVYERLPFDAQHRKLLELDPHPGAVEDPLPRP